MGVENQQPEPNSLKYYNYLKQNKADVPPNYEAFVNTLSNPENARKYHSYVKSKNLDAPADYEKWAQKLEVGEYAVKKKEETLLPDASLFVAAKPQAGSMAGEEAQPTTLEPAQPSEDELALPEPSFNKDALEEGIKRFQSNIAKSPEEMRFAFEKERQEKAMAKSYITQNEEFFGKGEQRLTKAQDKIIYGDEYKGIQPIASFNKAVVTAASALPKTVAVLAQKLDKTFGTDKNIEDYATYQYGKWIDETAENLGITTMDPRQQEAFWATKVPQGLGSAFSIMIGGVGNTLKSGVLKGASATTAKQAYMETAKEIVSFMRSPGATIGMTTAGISGFEDAKRNGADDDTAFKVFLREAAGGSTEALPLVNILSRLNKFSGGGVVAVLREGFKGGIEELMQESMQTFLSNLTAREYYDKTRGLIDGMLDSGATGFVVGFLLGGIGSGAQSLPPNERQRVLDYLDEVKKKSKDVYGVETSVLYPTGDLGAKPGYKAGDVVELSIKPEAAKPAEKVTPEQPKAAAPVEQKQEEVISPEAEQPAEAGKEDGGVEEVKPIRQLGTGANVYFETPKYRVNDNIKNGKVLVNIGDLKGEVPIANVDFDSPSEAVFVAKKLQENAPEGLDADFHNVDKIVEGYKKEYSELQLANVKENEAQPAPSGGVEPALPKAEEEKALPAPKEKKAKSKKVEYSPEAIEIARQYDEEVRNPSSNYKDIAISDALVRAKISSESFERWGDRNDITPSIAKAYLVGKGKGSGIDQIAEKINADLGEGTVTPEDIVNFIKSYPSGPSSLNRPAGNPKLYDLAQKFAELTGKAINKKTARSIVKGTAAMNIVGDKTPDGLDPVEVIDNFDEVLDSSGETLEDQKELVDYTGDFLDDSYSPEEKEKLNKILNDFRKEDGNIDWNKVKEEINGFNGDILDLPAKAYEKLRQLAEEGPQQKAKSSETKSGKGDVISPDIEKQNEKGEEQVKPKETPAPKSNKPAPKRSSNPKIAEKEQKLDDLFKKLGKQLGNRGSLTSGINPEALATGMEIVKTYAEIGVLKLGDMLSDVKQRYGADALRDYFDAIKAAYGSILATEDIDGMDDMKDVKKIKVEDIVNLEENEEQDQEVEAEQDQREDGAEEVAEGYGTENNSGSQDRPSDTDGSNGVRVRPPLIYAPGELPVVPETISPDTYDGQIDGHQALAINMALNRFSSGGVGFILADGTGVGKTRELLGIADQMAKHGKVLIITQNDGIIADAFEPDARAMGIDIKKFEIGTYTGLAGVKNKKTGVVTKKVGQGEYVLAIFDEAHNLKNATTAKTIAYGNVKTKHKVFATATPMDKHEGAAYFIAETLNISEKSAYGMLGLNVSYKEKANGEKIKIVSLMKGMKPDMVDKKVIEVRHKMMAAGSLIRREYPFFGTMGETTLPASNQLTQEQEMIEEHWDNKIEEARANGMFQTVGSLIGQKTMEMGRWNEKFKINYAFDKAKKLIAEGKQVIIVAETVNEMTIKGLEELGDNGDNVYPGTLGLLASKFEKEGITTSKVYGSNKEINGKKENIYEVDKFQSGKNKVLLMTPTSGGTGINLDDKVGDTPRVMLIITPNFAGDQFQQVIGRVSRRNTKSPAQVEIIYTDSNTDKHRKKVVERKLTVLRAIQDGRLEEEQMEMEGIDANGEMLVPDSKVPMTLTIIDINENQFMVTGNTYPIKDRLREFGGKWDKYKKVWVFPNMKTTQVPALRDMNTPLKVSIQKFIDGIQGSKPQAQFPLDRLDGRSMHQVQTASKLIGTEGLKALVKKLAPKFKLFKKPVKVVTDMPTFKKAWEELNENGGHVLMQTGALIESFYSPIERQLEQMKVDKLPAKQWADKLTGDEAKWTGLKDWLESKKKDAELYKGKTEIKKYPDGRYAVRWKDGGGSLSGFLNTEKEANDFVSGNVTKTEIQQFLKDNRIEIKEVVKGSYPKEVEELYKKLEAKNKGRSFDDWDSKDQDEWMSKRGEPQKTTYSQYQLEGEKENYKEVLVTLPSVDTSKRIKDLENKIEDAKRRQKEEKDILRRGGIFTNEIQPLELQLSEAKGQDRVGSVKFQSSHFDESNILVHLRMNVRKDSEGNKVLFLEEVQSDWGQKGKREGFTVKQVNPEDVTILSDEEKYYDDEKGDYRHYVTFKVKGFPDADGVSYYPKLESKKQLIDRLAKAYTKDMVASVPPAPFVTDTNAWTKLAVKVALKEAVSQGVNKIAWTTGEQQNERYDLSKQVDEIIATKMPEGTYNIFGNKNGSTIVVKDNLKENELDGVVGKELAQKIINGENLEELDIIQKAKGVVPKQSFKGNDLKVGGKGMKGFYGSPNENSLGILGNVVKSYTKQEPKTIIINQGAKRTAEKWNDITEEMEIIEYEAVGSKKSTQHSIDITPELIDRVSGGQPLFQMPVVEKPYSFVTRDGKPIGFNYDTDQLARERFNIPSLEKIGSGSDRDVFDLGDGKVLKIAKTARGLEQNTYEGDWYLIESGIIPQAFERGINYVVTEKVQQATKKAAVNEFEVRQIPGKEMIYGIYVNGDYLYDNKEYNTYKKAKEDAAKLTESTAQEADNTVEGMDKLNKLLAELDKFDQRDFDNHSAELQQVLNNNDISSTDLMSYDIIWADFKAKRNWGIKDGQPIHLDGGTFGGVKMIQRYLGKKNLSDPDFRKIYIDSKKFKKQYGDADKYTMFQKQPSSVMPNGFIYKDTIYLNPETARMDTPIHEFGHLWVTALAHSEPHKPLYMAMAAAVKNSPYYKEVINNPTYASLTDFQIINEALSMGIGERGALMENQSLWKKLWREFTEFVKRMLGIKKQIDLNNFTINDFLDIAASELLSPGQIGHLNSVHLPETVSFRLKRYKMPKDAWAAWKTRAIAEKIIGKNRQAWVRSVLGYKAVLWHDLLAGLQDKTHYMKLFQEDIIGHFQKLAIENVNNDASLSSDEKKKAIAYMKENKPALKEAVLGDQFDIHGQLDVGQGKVAYQYENIKKIFFGNPPAETGYGDVFKFLTLHTDITGKVLMDKDSIGYKLAQVGLNLLDLGTYMIAKHIPKRNAHFKAKNQDVENQSGVSDQQALEILKAYESNPEALAVLQDSEKVFREQVIKKNLDIQLENNMITQAQYDTLLNAFDGTYVPWNVSVKQNGSNSARYTGNIGKGVYNRIKSLTPRGQEYGFETRVNPFVMAIQNLEKTIAAAEKNKTLNNLAELIKANPDPSVWEVKHIAHEAIVDPVNGRVEYKVINMSERAAEELKQTGFRFYDANGNVKYIVINDPNLAKAIRSSDNNEAVGPIARVIMNIMQNAMNYLRFTQTAASANFIASNLVRDIQDAVINLQAHEIKGLARRVLKLVPSSAFTILQWERGKLDPTSEMGMWLDEMKREGGEISWLSSEGMEKITEDIYSEVDAFNASKKASVVGGLLWPVRSTLRAVMLTNKVVEQQLRFATYVALREKGISPQKAALAAKNVTVNFNRMGAWKGFRLAYMYLNPSIQGVATQLNTLAKSKKARKVVLATTVAFMASRFLLEALAEDDDELKDAIAKLNDKDYSQNLILPNPVSSTKFFKIPISYNLRPYKAVADGTYDAIRGNKTLPKIASHITSEFVSSYIPMSEQLFIPTLALPIAEPAMNEVMFSGKPVYKEAFGFKKKDSELYFNSASPIAIEASRLMGNVFEQTDDILEIHPDMIDYYSNWLMGGMRAYVSTPVEAGEVIFGDKAIQDLDMNKIIIASRFVVDVEKQDYRATMRYYNLYEELMTSREGTSKSNTYDEFIKVSSQLIKNGQLDSREANRKSKEIRKQQAARFNKTLKTYSLRRSGEIMRFDQDD